jgi:hypothetical protein
MYRDAFGAAMDAAHVAVKYRDARVLPQLSYKPRCSRKSDGSTLNDGCDAKAKPRELIT